MATKTGRDAGAWPRHELQHLDRCPLCGEISRELLHDGLTDEVFRCAPGRWSLYRCGKCRNAYLDPRPDEGSIGRAYNSYYTHDRPKARVSYPSLSVTRKMKRKAANGYTNFRYGTSYQPSSSKLGALLQALPPLRHALDVQYRWLPKPTRGARLLDVGCGNGAFLRNAAAAGWDVYGADPDEKAIREAHAMGGHARLGGIDAYSDMAGTFDCVTFSHSVEHLHDPVQDLRTAWGLLKPGGVLFIDTPDLDSPGRVRFGASWRGMEAPRHLVLFSREGLATTLDDLGFHKFDFYKRHKVDRGMNVASMMIEQGDSPYDRPPKSVVLRASILAFFARLKASPEFITLTCIRPAE